MDATKHFWNGFEGRDKSPKHGVKKYMVILFWSEKDKRAVEPFGRMRIKHPSVKVKMISSPSKMKAHNVTAAPTIILLKNGREVERVTGAETASDSVLSQLFRRAYM